MNSFWFCENWVLKKYLDLYLILEKTFLRISWKKISSKIFEKMFCKHFYEKNSWTFFGLGKFHFQKVIFFYYVLTQEKNVENLFCEKKKEFLEKRFMTNCVNNFPLIKKNLKSYIYKKIPTKCLSWGKYFFFTCFHRLKEKKSTLNDYLGKTISPTSFQVLHQRTENTLDQT